jgi:hypothetical protein
MDEVTSFLLNLAKTLCSIMSVLGWNNFPEIDGGARHSVRVDCGTIESGTHGVTRPTIHF